MKPAGYALWENISRELDAKIRATGAQNAYFPLLIPTSFLSKEADHIEGFAKECAVVTHHRLRGSAGGGVEPDPDAKLADPLVVRPTSETVIWDSFSRWVRSHRDLPLLMNQWANVMRWELRTRPFLRTSEFLWQEGHTAHATADDARQFALRMQGVYTSLLQDVLAVPVVAGRKSSSERFAGADDTLTCEAILQNGWALQSATSHVLGQHFSKAFDVQYLKADGTRDYVHGTSWGASTRLIGAIIMSHSDDVGLVLPPAVAPVQVVLMPIAPKKAGGAEKTDATAFCTGLAHELRASGVRVAVDHDIGTPAGSRFYAWERQGVPLRIEIGERDIRAGTGVTRDRLGGPRGTIPITEGFQTVAAVKVLLKDIQHRMYERARQRTDAFIVTLDSYEQLKAEAKAASKGGDADDEGAAAGAHTKRGHADVSTPYVAPFKAYLVPWYDDAANEARVKSETKYTLRCYPDEHQRAAIGKTCFLSGKPATHMALFARAY